MDFSSYLKNLIKKSGYSYRKLGSLSGVNHTYLSKICRGSSGVPSPEILKKIAVPLFIPYEDLLRAAGYLLSESNAPYSSDPAEDILLRVARLTSEGKEKLSEYLDFLEDWERKQKKRKRKQSEQL